MRYRTIVADPPWHYDGTDLHLGVNDWRRDSPRPPSRKTGLPYRTMTVEEICALPVSTWAADDAHLYLWTTRRYLPHAFSVCRAWGFRYSTTLTWCKSPMGFMGGAFVAASEYVLFCRRGSLAHLERVERDWFEWPRTAHSAKPEAFLDMVERVSPGPYLEMFARRARLGDWHYWGDQSLGTAEVAA